MRISGDELTQLEGDVATALAAGDASGLNVLGHGEISLVLGWPFDVPAWACKRLPTFPSAEAARTYGAAIHRYLRHLEARGVDVLDTDVRQLPAAGAGVALYCVQPVLPPATLATDVVRNDATRAADVLGAVVRHILEVTDRRVGLDAQLSNWAVGDNGLRYVDVTTPLLRTAGGREDLDAGVFLASLPWLLRRPVRRFVIPEVLARYHEPRTVVLDLAANLIKERLDHHIITVLDLAGDRVEPPLDEPEVRADYRSDARTWAALQAVRRLDRAWQRRVRRRPYPFLLPERIDR